MFGYCAPLAGDEERHLPLAAERLGREVEARGIADLPAARIGQPVDRPRSF